MKGSGIDVMHDCEPVDREEAHLCENFIVQKGDPRFQDVFIDGVRKDATGSWAVVMKLNSERLRAPFRTGEWSGVSMWGSALVSPVSKSGTFPDALADRLGSTSTPKENEMDETKLAEAIAKALAPVVAKIEEVAKAVATDPDADATKETPVIKFTGDANKLEDVEAHEELVFKASLDFSDPDDLAKWKAHLSKKAEVAAEIKKIADEKEGAPENETAAQRELRVAKARVVELSKASNQSGDDVAPSNETANERMTRIRKTAKSTVDKVLVSQGRRQPAAA